MRHKINVVTMSAMERENAKTVEYLEAKLKNSNM